MSRWRVRLGFVLGVLTLVLADPQPLSVALGAPLALVGEAIRLWASGHILKTQALATGGPYAHSRNPLYLGSLLMALGVAIAAANAWVVLAMLIYFGTFYPFVVREEEAFLRQKFPEAFQQWAQHVPVLLPRLTPAGPRGSRFEWQRVRINREWQAALALPVAAALFALRAWLRG